MEIHQLSIKELVYFVTSRRVLPLPRGKKIQITFDASDTWASIPTSATCFSKLHLPWAAALRQLRTDWNSNGSLLIRSTIAENLSIAVQNSEATYMGMH